MSQNIKQQIVDILEEYARQHYLYTEESHLGYGDMNDINNRAKEAILKLIISELPKEPYCKYMDEVTNQAYLEGFEDYCSEMLKILEGK
jgi:hypothetical protein